MSMDMNKMLQQAQQMQAQMAKAQEELRTRPSRPRPAAAWSPSRRPGRGEITEIKIDAGGDRPRRPGAARGHGARRGQRGAALGAGLAESKLGCAMGGLQGLGLPGL